MHKGSVITVERLSARIMGRKETPHLLVVLFPYAIDRTVGLCIGAVGGEISGNGV